MDEPNHERGSYQDPPRRRVCLTICVYGTTFLLNAAGTDLREEVGAEDANGKHNQHKRDKELNKRRENLTNLERDSTHRDLELRNTLAGSRSRGKERGHDAVREGREELRHHVSEIEPGRQNDDVLGIEHLSVNPEKKQLPKMDLFCQGKRSVEMDTYTRLMDAIASYRPTSTDLLRYLRSQRKYHGDSFCLDESHEWSRNYQEDEFWGTYASEVPRDENGVVLVDKAFQWTTRYIDDFYAEGELVPFVRTMGRMEALKEELMMVAWHPKRVEQFLNKWGEDAFDNFVGV